MWLQIATTGYYLFEVIIYYCKKIVNKKTKEIKKEPQI